MTAMRKVKKQKLPAVKIPNKATLKAMKDAEEGRNLSSYDSLDAFLEKMRS